MQARMQILDKRQMFILAMRVMLCRVALVVVTGGVLSPLLLMLSVFTFHCFDSHLLRDHLRNTSSEYLCPLQLRITYCLRIILLSEERQ